MLGDQAGDIADAMDVRVAVFLVEPESFRQVGSDLVAVEERHVAAELREPNARAVVRALAADLGTAPRLLDKDAFRAAAGRVKGATGQKGKALFHPIRVALTGEAEGPELDLIVPAIDRAAQLAADSGLARVIGGRERAALIAASL